MQGTNEGALKFQRGFDCVQFVYRKKSSKTKKCLLVMHRNRQDTLAVELNVMCKCNVYTSGEMISPFLCGMAMSHIHNKITKTRGSKGVFFFLIQISPRAE